MGSARIRRRSLAWLALGAAIAFMGGCQGESPSAPKPMEPATPKIVLLSRDGCPLTPAMRKNLDGALSLLGWRQRYAVVDAGRLPATDATRQYGTPTVLVDGKELTGQPLPQPSKAEPG